MHARTQTHAQPTTAWDSKPEQSRLMTRLLVAMPQPPAVSRSTLQKRLQRARKYVVVVGVFGTSVLSAVPEVTVSRLDGLSLGELGRMKASIVQDQSLIASSAIVSEARLSVPVLLAQ